MKPQNTHRVDNVSAALAPIAEFGAVSVRWNADRDKTYVGDILPATLLAGEPYLTANGNPRKDEEGNPLLRPLTFAEFVSRLETTGTRGAKPGGNGSEDSESNSADDSADDSADEE